MLRSDHVVQVQPHKQAEPNKLYVGEGVGIRGEIGVPDIIVVDGLLEGDVTTNTLIVGPTGTVKGKVTVLGDADIYGKSLEKLEVKNLLIVRSTGSINGSVSYGELLIERGAVIAGGLSSTDYRNEKKPAKNKKKLPKFELPFGSAKRPRHYNLPSAQYVSETAVKSQNLRNAEGKSKSDGNGRHR